MDRERNEFQRRIREKERRIIRAQKRGKQSVWQGFGVFGLIGWSIAVPTVLLGLLGVFLDERYSGRQSYTLALLLAGLFLGCFNAWYWVSQKMKEIQEEAEEPPEDRRDE